MANLQYVKSAARIIVVRLKEVILAIAVSTVSLGEYVKVIALTLGKSGQKAKADIYRAHYPEI
jgi:UDP-N-acetyl-D-mannosaminuronate dehydrogenase